MEHAIEALSAVRGTVSFSKGVSAEQLFLELLRAELGRRVGEAWFKKEVELYTPLTDSPGSRPALWFDEIAITVDLNSAGWLELNFLAPIEQGEGMFHSSVSFIIAFKTAEVIPRVAREVVALFTGFSKLFQRKLGSKLIHSEVMFEDLSEYERLEWRQRRIE